MSPITSNTAATGLPTLSCIIASYNHAPYVVSAIETCLRVPVVEKELIVIDDGSKDDSVARIREAVARLGSAHDIRVIERENHGLVSSLNHALTMSRGEFIFIIASDDLAIPLGVATLVTALRSCASAGFAMGNSLAFFDEADTLVGLPVYGDLHARYFALSARERDASAFTHYPNPLLIQSTVFRREALARIGDFDAELVLDDYPLFIRLMREHPLVGKDLLFMPEVFAAAYRQHAGNSHRNRQRQVQMLTQVIERLCPPAERDAALCRLNLHYALLAGRDRHIGESLRLVRSAVGHGLWRTIVAFSHEMSAYLDRSRSRAGPMTLPHPVQHRG